jgi:hypothetical protein
VPPKAPAIASTAITTPTDATPAMKERTRLMQVIGAAVRQLWLKVFTNSYAALSP